MIREFALGRDRLVARAPVQPGEQMAQRPGGVRQEGDLGRSRGDELRQPGAQLVVIGKPGEEIGARVFAAVGQWRAMASSARRGSWPKVAVLR